MCLSFEVSIVPVAFESFPSPASSRRAMGLLISLSPNLLGQQAHLPLVPETFTSSCPPPVSLYLLTPPTFASPREKSGGNKRGVALGECSGKTF